MIQEVNDENMLQNMQNMYGKIIEQDEEDSKLETQKEETGESESEYTYYSETYHSASRASQVRSPIKIQKDTLLEADM